MMKNEQVKPRRPWDPDIPTGYMESDRDYVLNNLDLAVKLLDQLQEEKADDKEAEDAVD
jgi:hypothetical protein